MYKNQMPGVSTRLPDPDIFFYNAAHDLLAPLMSIKTLIDIMRNDTEKQNIDNYLNLIEQSIEKVNQSIGQTIHSLKNRHVESVSLPVDFKRIAEEAIQAIRFIAIQRFVRIELVVDQREIFFSLEQPLKSIFNNLLSNAIMYRDETKLSSVYLHITFDEQGAHILFKDNGIGIEEEMVEKIFNKFFTVNHDHEGSGLGLFIVKSAVENLGGTIKVQSEVGKGTTFTIRIPNGKP
ncbi:MAG: HAMP domain-containing histidine kinase [Bacteroidia bacterium]|nr:HAMP domain-containing histidine kinase [Bacteroidia bacterium]